ncbi:hypothetical protein ACOSP6_06550 [Tenacibaculum sp. MEBiC06402]|uniref:hypothetical protein n=1 Tax=unclassified Tenacibaculum TaxID=2635139 RepID=UPI003B9D77AA
MPKDIRGLAKDFQRKSVELSENHEEKFLKRLQEEFPKPKKSFKWLYAVASIIVLLGFGVQFYPVVNPTDPKPVTTTDTEQVVNLGDISPEMQKIENYYLTAINYEIASLEVTPENKALLDEYFERISKLDADYKRLNQKLQKEGVNNETIDALITNLQLRLQLLIQLKDQVNDLQSKQSKDESYTI